MSSLFAGLKSFLTFSKGERNGLIILLFIILLLLFAPLFFQSVLSPIPSKNFEFYNRVDSFFSSLNVKPDDALHLPTNPVEYEEVVNAQIRKPFFFDPNKVTINELVDLGLSLKQATVIINYRNKGGLFRNPEDFLKIYVIDSSTYSKLKPWIKISPITNNYLVKKDTIAEVENLKIVIEINTADTLTLTKIKGIGKVFARRIVAYRSLLGGYVDLNQLKEVYGMKPELVESISTQITIEKDRINHININLITFEDLKKHPYLTEYQAKAIVYYRSKVGNIKDINELVENKILPKEIFQKVKEYLVVS